MGDILTQTGGTGATGDLTTAIGNNRLSVLCGGSDGTVSTAIVTDVIESAESDALSILGPGFNTSAASSKTVVKHQTKLIAVYYAYCRVPEFRNAQGETIVAPQYNKAIERLKDIAKGERDMGDETATGKSAVRGGIVNYSTKAFIVETAESSTGPTGGF